jgi:hypothetical protein
MTKLGSDTTTYLLHRIGAIFGFAGISLFVIFFTENQSILNEAFGRAYFFWVWGLIMATIPLIVGLSRGDSLKCFFFIFLLMGSFGALALVVPADALPRIVSIVTIAILLVSMLLKRSHRGSLILDLKPNASPHTFAESLAILAVSWACASALQFSRVMSGAFTFSSPIAEYMLLWIVFFVIVSLILMVTRTLTHRSNIQNPSTRQGQDEFG